MANSPPVQTPVNFLKAGAGGMFSDECVKLLAEYGYEPEDFGDYDHVLARCKAARDVPPKQRTPHERFLAGCQSGHLQQNATSQRQRGNPCSNLVDGHDANRYPCMPHEGRADNPGSEHNLVSQHENESPMAGNPPLAREQSSRDNPDAPRDGRPPAAGSVYPADRASADSDERTRQMLDRRERKPQPTTTDPSGKSGEAGGSGPGGAGDAAGSSGGTAGAPTAPNQPSDGKITGDTAAECINNFRKAGEAAMKKQCVHNMADNRRIANGGGSPAEGRAYRARLQKERDNAAGARDSARQASTEATASREQADRNVAAAHADHQENPSRESRQALAAARTQQGIANGNEAQAQDNQATAESQYNSAASRYSRVRNAQCRFEQGGRILAGRGRDDGRVPAENTLVGGSSQAPTDTETF